MRKQRCFGLIPAAGASRRMGCHKLLLPIHGQRVIDRVASAWQNSVVDHVVIVLRSADNDLIAACQQYEIETVPLQLETSDMKATILAGLEFLKSTYDPDPADYCLIAPADLPSLSASIIDRIADAVTNEIDKVFVPMFGEKRGHPIAFSWHKSQQVFELPSDEGIDALIDRSETTAIHFDAALRPQDIDTPDDYRRHLQQESIDKRRTP